MNLALSYYLGLDLGQKRDFSALVILERRGEGKTALFHARHIQRYALGTSYPAIVLDVADKLTRLPASNNLPTLALDETGVGVAVTDLFRAAKLKARLKPICITGGDRVTREGDTWRVPKRELVSVTQVALQTDRLKIAAALPEAATLVRELESFQVKITDAAHDVYGSWREGQHDDLVLAVAMALWEGTRINAKLITWS
jgi:hypothetical protein